MSAELKGLTEFLLGLGVEEVPHSGRNYLGKLYNDGWLREAGLLGADEQVADYDWRATQPGVVVRSEGSA